MKYLAYAATLIWAVIAAFNISHCASPAQEQASSSPAMEQAAVSAPQIADDGSLLLPLSSSDRDHIRGEMRGFLISLQALTEAIAMEDRASIAEAAAAMGRKRGDQHHRTVMQRRPQEFRMMGRDMRNGFEDIAAKAETASMLELLEDLSFNLHHCASCHATWRVTEIESAD